MNRENLVRIKQTLLDCADRFSSEELFPTLLPEALQFVLSNPYAFAIAISLDRGTKADIIWTIPYYIKNELGFLDPVRINSMTLEETAALFSRLPKRPRYINDAPRTLKELTALVINKFDGDASRIWLGKSAADVINTFQSIHGVGTGIANMAVLLIEAAYHHLNKSDFDVKPHSGTLRAFFKIFEDKSNMDIKPDTHTMRVLYRLGVAQDISFASAIQAARSLSPDFPGAVDGALWWIGRTWCFPTNPVCSECCAQQICAKRIN